MRNESVKTWNRSVGLPTSPHFEGTVYFFSMFVVFGCSVDRVRVLEYEIHGRELNWDV